MPDRHHRVTIARRAVATAGLCALLLGATIAPRAESDGAAPLGWQGAAQLVELPDLNPDP